MKCESCKIKDHEISEHYEEGYQPFLLCKDCHNRLVNLALRPLEFFNLVAIHGQTYFLFDNFYDYDTGEAEVPEIEILEVNQFPFPKFEDVENNLSRLIDYSFVQESIDDIVIEKLKSYKKEDVLKELIKRVKYNNPIKYRAFEVAAKIIGKDAQNWIRQEWSNRKENELLIFAEVLVSCLNFKEAFKNITEEIEQLDDKLLSDNISALIYFEDGKILDWIERMTPRIINISSNWGQLAASSKFDWARALKWLNTNRPLSLIALDAIYYCTTVGERRNQSLWMRELDPKLIGHPDYDEFITTLTEYLKIDNVPRTRNIVNAIIKNVS